MAVLMTLEFEATADQYDQVNEKIDARPTRPTGCSSTPRRTSAASMKVIDVWESADAFNAFAERRLGPAVAEVLGDGGGEAPGPEVRELYNVIRP